MEFKHLEETLNRFGDFVSTRYQSYAPEATGNLVNNIGFQVDVKGNKYEVMLSMPVYWKWVEDGRKSGKMPPINNILEWIQAKPVIPREVNGKLPTEKQLAYLIARSIGENGTEGKHILEKSVQEGLAEMLESIKYAFLEDIKEDMDNVLMFVR